MTTKAEKTRDLIIEKAAAVLNKKGMAGTSISDIMEATKLAKGGIYGNFSNKEEICTEAFNFLSQNLSRKIEASLNEKTTAKAKLFALIDHYATLLQAGTGGCPILNFGTEADDTDPVIKEKVALAIKTAQARISNLVKDGMAAGEFNSCLDADIFAVKMFAMVEGAIFFSRVLDNSDQMTMISHLLKSEIEAFSN